MQLRQVMIFLQMLTIQTIVVLLISILPVWAAGNQSNQAMNQPALLIAPDPAFQVNVYPKPGTDRRRIGYGSGGDSVTVIEQVGSNEGYTWNYVEFDNPPQLKGWIREDFVALQENDRQNPVSTNPYNDRSHQQTNRQNQRYREEQHPYRGHDSYQGYQRQNNYNQRQN